MDTRRQGFRMGAVWISLLLVTSMAAVVSGDPEPGVQKYCPVMGGRIDTSVHADHQGKRVYFCCPGCIKVFEKNPASYIETMESRGVVLEKAPREE